MKKTNFKDILIHSLELKVFLVQLERLLYQFNIQLPKPNRLPASEEQSEEHS